MFNSVVTFLREELNTFIAQKIGATGNFVSFANLNNVNEANPNLDNKIIASIVNMEEEKVLKSPENFVRLNQEIAYRQPAVWINVVVVFTYFTRSTENYTGIDMLYHVMQYFQTKPKLLKTNAINASLFPNGIEELRSEFVSLNYEQTNYLWGLFGGKYHPSVVYKLKSIPVDNAELSAGPAILDTEVVAEHFLKN